MTSYSSKTRAPARASQKFRFLIVRLMVLVPFISLGTRLVYVQAILRGELQRKAAEQLPSKNTAPSERFRIFDREKVPLCETVSILSCYVDPTMMSNKTSATRQLAALLSLNDGRLAEDLRKEKSSFLWIKRNVPPSVVQAIKEKKIPGVGFKKEWRRHYPSGALAGHLLGMVGVDGKGLSGMEQQYDSLLSGRAIGEMKGGVPLPSHGSLQLTIDRSVQQIVERELQWGVDKIKAKKGMAIVQDPRTGEILAMAAWPSLSLDADNPPTSMDIRIPPVVDVFEPGSTFKIVTAAAVIEEKLVKSGELFSGEKGEWNVADIVIHDHEPRGMMTFDDIFAYSSNIGTAKLADRIGNQKLYQYARLFGFGVLPASGIPAEAKGMLRPPSKWSGVSKNVISFGQEVGVTALQLCGAYSAIANGGVLMEPNVVKAILDERGTPVWTCEPSTVRRVVTVQTAQRLTSILMKVVQVGTGQSAQVKWRGDIHVAGKTGTAQKYDASKKGYDNDLTIVSFCGFFPVEAPRYTIVVILDEPEGRRWGGVDAAPIFRRIAEQLIATPPPTS